MKTANQAWFQETSTYYRNLIFTTFRKDRIFIIPLFTNKGRHKSWSVQLSQCGQDLKLCSSALSSLSCLIPLRSSVAIWWISCLVCEVNHGWDGLNIFQFHLSLIIIHLGKSIGCRTGLKNSSGIFWDDQNTSAERALAFLLAFGA